MAEEAMTW